MCSLSLVFYFSVKVLFVHQTRNSLMGPTCLIDDPSHRIRPKHSVGCKSNFCSPNPIRLGVGQSKTRNDPTRAHS